MLAFDPLKQPVIPGPSIQLPGPDICQRQTLPCKNMASLKEKAKTKDRSWQPCMLIVFQLLFVDQYHLLLNLHLKELPSGGRTNSRTGFGLQLCAFMAYLFSIYNHIIKHFLCGPQPAENVSSKARRSIYLL